MIKSNLSDTDKAIIIFNYLFNGDMLVKSKLASIAFKMGQLDSEYTNVDSEQLHDLIYNYYDAFETEVKLYRPWNPFSKAYATTFTGNYNLIKLNSRRLNRSVASIAGSIAHEWGHCLEYYVRKEVDADLYFNHGDNSPVGKDDTFQYKFGRRVKRYVQDNYDRLIRDIGIN